MESTQKIVFEFDREQSKEFLTIMKEIKQVLTHPGRQNSDNNSLLTISQASELINLAKPTIYTLTSKGEIPFIKKGKKLYFKKVELLTWLTNGNKVTNEMLTK